MLKIFYLNYPRINSKFAALFKVNAIPLKGKIINDPIYGFLTFRNKLLLKVIDHPYFQRLRGIKQMGMANFVYPGATHTRFHHSLGAAHLMKQAITSLKDKGQKIPESTSISAQIAILLHDIGHGPFSHALEQSIANEMHHEELSLKIMELINDEMDGVLQEAIDIFKGVHPTKYLSQLVSGQLDMDRMDYLNRDSFYTGVSEGVIGYDRILQMLHVHNDELVIESKGIHSVEKFLIARRLMYWQVYLHKAVLGTEQLLIQILRRANTLAKNGDQLFASPAFSYFLYNDINRAHFSNNTESIERFIELDDADIMVSIKTWQNHPDRVLSLLCKMMVGRKLYKVKLSTHNLESNYEEIKSKILKNQLYSEDELSYLLIYGKAGNDTYSSKGKINIIYKNGEIVELSNIENPLITEEIAKPVTKEFIAICPELASYINFNS